MQLPSTSDADHKQAEFIYTGSRKKWCTAGDESFPTCYLLHRTFHTHSIGGDFFLESAEDIADLRVTRITDQEGEELEVCIRDGRH